MQVDFTKKIDENSLVLSLLVSFIALINIYLLFTVPVFGDGVIYAKLTLDIINEGFMHGNISYLPNFFLISAVLTLFTKNVEVTLAILNIIPILLLIILMYSILSKQFNKQVGLYTAVFLSFTPMFLWVISHRLIDPLTYFFPVLFIWAYLHFIRSFNFKKGILIAIFLSAMMGLKPTLLPFVIGIFLHMIYLLFKNTKKQRIKIIKGMGIIGFFAILLFIPYLQYYLPYAQYIDPQEKFEDQYLFSILPEQKLEQINQIQNKFWTKQGILSCFFGDLKEGKITGALQFFSILPVYENARWHWFSPFADVTWSIFLVIFLLGITYWIKGDFLREDYSKILIFMTIAVIPFFRFFAIMRYLFYLNIIASVFYGFGLYYVVKKIKIPRFSKLLVTMIIIVSLLLLTTGEVEWILPYKNSYGHNRVSRGGILELVEVKNDIPEIVGTTIFTPASEPVYYLNGKTMWEWRIFFVDNEENVLNYFKYHNITYLIIPKYSLSYKAWDGHRWVSNKLETLANPVTVPRDTTFHRMLNNGTFQKIKTYEAFMVYRVQINDS